MGFCLAAALILPPRDQLRLLADDVAQRDARLFLTNHPRRRLGPSVASLDVADDGPTAFVHDHSLDAHNLHCQRNLGALAD
jgi:hypothetical protein